MRNTIMRARNNEAGRLLAPALRDVAAELHRRHVPAQYEVGLIATGGPGHEDFKVSNRRGWWLELNEGTAQREGLALWIDRDGRHWDDSEVNPAWNLHSARNPERLPRWTPRADGPQHEKGRLPTFEVVVDRRVDGGLAVVSSFENGRHGEIRRPLVEMMDQAVAKAAEHERS